jgi:uncharacterized spore protein YtfJ
MIDTFGAVTSESLEAGTLTKVMADKIYAAAQPGAVFSAPVVSGPYTIITASEVAAAGGFGFGTGSGSRQASGETLPSGQPAPIASGGGGSGGGGGGGSSGRPVAAIVISPAGVKVEPIVDVTKLALAAIGAWLSIALLLVRARRGQRSATRGQ